MTWLPVLLALTGLAADPTSSTGRCPDGRVWTTSAREQAQMLGVLNQVRTDQRRQPLARHGVMDQMAMAQAVDMACRDYFSHRNPERDRLQDRFKRVNDGSLSGWRHLAEILGTSQSPYRQVEVWLDSSSHRRALLEDDHDLVGIGLVRVASGSRYSTYWAVEFLAQRR